MAEVIDLAARRRSWTHSIAHCIGCDHEWMSVSPCEQKWIECPKCKALKGLRKNITVPGDWAMVFMCPHCKTTIWTPYLDKKTGVACLMCVECGGVRNAMELFPTE